MVDCREDSLRHHRYCKACSAVTPSRACDGDTNCDQVNDIDDIVNVVLDFGTDGSGHGGDVNGSGLVDIDDIVFVVLNFGNVCS